MKLLRSVAAVAVAVAAAALAGCGVGIGIEIGDGYDRPPTVSLAVAGDGTAPGQTVRLVAAASDDDFVVEVSFYRIEPSGRATWLCSDAVPEYDCHTVIPSGTAPGSLVRYFARAVDSRGQHADSARVDIRVS